MELRDLEYFLCCIEHGSLTQAAAELHVTQPTLSHAISRLEDAAGEALLYRPANKRNPLTVTPAGELLQQRSQRIQDELQGFNQDLDAMRGLLRGHLRLCGIQSLNLTLLPGVLAQFSQQHQQIEVHLSTRPSDEIPQLVRSGHDEIGIFAGAPSHALDKLRQEELYREDFVAIVRQDDPLASQQTIGIKELIGRDLLLMNANSYTGTTIYQACQKAGFTPHPRLSLESGEALRETVRAGLGLSILPRGYLTDNDADLRAINLVKPTPWRQVLAISLVDRELSRAANAFLTTLRKWVTLRK
ncbi:MAG: LysR family transcriptional regulator [Planctomycetes bacterium]|nr:LysR family transcriptional regulator [Planctomycetota bacterium]